jgi:peptide/nickel transport system substrate-binding protein
VFSDGVPFTSDDVVFSFAAVYDEKVNGPLRDAMMVNGHALQVSAPDRSTVVITFPEAFAPGLRLLDNLPILPKHKLGAALAAGTFTEEWTPAKPLDTIAGLGPFVLTEHVSGQRLVFRRNPHYFRRDAVGSALPYLDTLTLAVVRDQNTEALRLQAGEIDLMSSGEIRATDYAAFKRLESEGRVQLHAVGVGLDPDLLWFNLSARGPGTPGRALLARKEFRQAISAAVDRQAIADTVYLGNAVPIAGPVSPGNARWYSAPPEPPRQDQARAKALLSGLGLADRDGDGTLETKDGSPARFSVLVQAGHIRAQVLAAVQAQLKAAGIQMDVVPMEGKAMLPLIQAGDYEAIYHGLQASSTDPALNSEFWLSSGNSHYWNPGQTSPTPWERRIDELMHEQSHAPDLAARQRAFAEVQQIMRDELPAIYFVAPRVSIATTRRVVNATPSLQLPQLLWSADTLAAAGPPAAR